MNLGEEKDYSKIYSYSGFNDNIKNMEEIKRMKEDLIQGNRYMLKGIYKFNPNSTYQDTYKAIPQKYKFEYNPDFYSSCVKGVMPEPYTQKIRKEGGVLSQNLKNTIENIMFR
jgi:hypothetical protein